MKRNAFSTLLLLILLVLFIPSTSVAKEEHRYIIGFKDKLDSALIEQFGGSIEQTLPSIQAIAARFPTEIRQELSLHPSVAYIEEDKRLTIKQQVIDWGIQSTNAPNVWKSGFTGKGVKVAVIDTGVDLNHQDLEIKKGISVVSYTNSYLDDNGHGTNVAGILAAKDNGIGIVGMAPDAELFIVKAFDKNGEGYHSHLIKGIEWAVNENVDIINLSVGSKAYSIGLLAAVNDAYRKGIIVVAAAGNHGSETGQGNNVEFPAAFESVIAVAAIDKQGRRASFSATGPQVEVAAPGVKILTTSLNGGYKYANGTSMATPHVSGYFALLKEAYPEFTAKKLRTLMHEQTINLGEGGRNEQTGYGRISLPLPFTKQEEEVSMKEQLFFSSTVKTFVFRQRLTPPYGDEIYFIPIVNHVKALQNK